MTQPTSRHHYGWSPDLPDYRDHVFAAAPPPGPLPAFIDLTSQCPPVVDQGQLGSCTANAISAALEFDQLRQGEPLTPLSRLFIYYNERAMEGTIASDSGAQIRDGIKSVAKLGACPESLWPYVIAAYTNQPSPVCYTEAVRYEAIQYRRITRALSQIKGCLASGNPFVFGFSVYESFESSEVAQTGDAPLPRHGERLLGGHATLCVGYDDSRERWICRNSWGTSWGKSGYFTLPYAYLLHRGLSSDFWAINRVK